MIIIVGNRHGDQISNPGRAIFILRSNLKKYAFNYSTSSYEEIVGQTGFCTLDMVTSLGEVRLFNSA